LLFAAIVASSACAASSATAISNWGYEISGEGISQPPPFFPPFICFCAQMIFITTPFIVTDNTNAAVSVESLPEPGTLSIPGLGLLGAGALRRRKASMPPSVAGGPV